MLTIVIILSLIGFLVCLDLLDHKNTELRQTTEARDTLFKKCTSLERDNIILRAENAENKTDLERLSAACDTWFKQCATLLSEVDELRKQRDVARNQVAESQKLIREMKHVQEFIRDANKRLRDELSNLSPGQGDYY